MILRPPISNLFPYTTPYRSTAVKKFGADYALQPVGTGPFKYVSWDRGQRVVLEKNPSYWRYPVKLDRVFYRPIVDRKSTRLNSSQSQISYAYFCLQKTTVRL